MLIRDPIFLLVIGLIVVIVVAIVVVIVVIIVGLLLVRLELILFVWFITFLVVRLVLLVVLFVLLFLRVIKRFTFCEFPLDVVTIAETFRIIDFDDLLCIVFQRKRRCSRWLIVLWCTS